MKTKVIIIGSGLGGLSCGVILAKNGYDVTVLEKEHQYGGCLQCFSRKGVKFETGMHFIGSTDKGQTLSRLLHYLEIEGDITLSRLDPDGYDVVSLNGRDYRIPMGREAFIRQLSEYYPHQHENITTYYNLIERLSSASSLHTMQEQNTFDAIGTEYQLRSVNEVIDSIITDEMLAKVLVGHLPLYSGIKGRTPFSDHAFITDFYNKSAYRIVGGSDGVAKALVRVIEKYGGKVLTRMNVDHIVCDDTHATDVEVKCGNTRRMLPADYIIAGIHPARTLEMLDTNLIRPAFRKRVSELPQTLGSFSVYLHFKENQVQYMNYNNYVYRDGDPWNCENYDDKSWPKGYLYMHFCDEDNQNFAKAGCVLSYMHIDDLKEWSNTRTGHRGQAYEDFKKRKAERIIDALNEKYPGIRNSIENYYTSTPLTYRDYTGTEQGSMYGIMHDITLGGACRIPQRTKIPNLLLTGQNINSHGMLGVLVGSIVTCSELLTAKEIYKQIQTI